MSAFMSSSTERHSAQVGEKKTLSCSSKIIATAALTLSSATGLLTCKTVTE